MTGKPSFHPELVSSEKVDPLHSTVDFPFEEIAARLDGETPNDGRGDYADAASLIRKLFLACTDVDIEREGSSKRVGERFLAAIKILHPRLLEERSDYARARK